MAAHPYLSICAGVGGLDLGLREALPGARAVCYVERELTAALVLGARMREGRLDEAPVWSDVRTFDGRPWRGKVAGIVGGYPCQPFSYAGARRGEQDERHLWPYIERIVGECEPQWCFLENVTGHVTLGYWDVVRPALESFGFRVAEALVEASDVGAPHKRQRLFILAARPQALGDAERKGWGQERPGLEADARREYEPGRDPLVNPEREGLQRRVLAECACTEERDLSHGPAAHTSDVLELPRAFPPRPDDRSCWEAVLSKWPLVAPALEPELCGVAHGPAPGVDIPFSARLQLLGNAVVPKQAALAFRLLSAVLTKGLDHGNS